MLADDARVEELLRAGTLPDIGPNHGSILAFARTPFAIDRLIALGAPIDMKDRWGSTPIDAMSRLGARGQSLVRHMVAIGVTATPKEYARLGDIETLARLIEADRTVARLDSVMMAAVDFRHHTLVEWLLERGANVQCPLGRALAAHGPPLGGLEWRPDDGPAARRGRRRPHRARRGARRNAAGLGRDVGHGHEQSQLRGSGRVSGGSAGLRPHHDAAPGLDIFRSRNMIGSCLVRPRL